MRQKKWTANEVALLWTEMTNWEIAQQTGRTPDSVKKKRFSVTGCYTRQSDKRDERKKTIQANTEYIDQLEKEHRIILLAKRLGVRIKGVR